jgi:antagonist of KipI
MGHIIIEKAGLLDTIQDYGRVGYQGEGMAVSGAMDSYSYLVGNLLLNNNRTSASIEMTLVGPHLRFTSPTKISITGANLNPKLNGKNIPLWQVVEVKENDLITFGSSKQGCRCYLSVDGGFQIPQVLGSYSTYVRGKIGGLHGGPLIQQDRLPYNAINKIKEKGNPLNKETNKHKLVLSHRFQPTFLDEMELRVVLGPEKERFTEKGLHDFLNQHYTVTPQMDRMGLRLEGISVEHIKGADIISDSIPLGTIQIPANGKPIILMSDRQTTGGYTRIGSVISIDIPKVAQALPRQKIKFVPISVENAQLLYRRRERFFKTLELLINNK